MVRGRSIAVTAVPRVVQCADTARIALGFGTDSPRRRQAAVYRFCSSVFIGLPCPKNTTGIRARLAVISDFLVTFHSVAKPILVWVPSQKGLVDEPPQRHK